MLATNDGLGRDVYLAIADTTPKYYGYMVRNYDRSSAVDYAPRFGTGKSDETDLTLLKAESYTFGGGMFQRREKDNDKNSILYGYYNGYDETLYPFPNGTLFGADYYGIPSAECYGNNTTFIASRIGSTNIIRKISDTGTHTTLSLPSALSSATIAITDMCVFGKYLVVVTQSASVSVSTFRFDMTTSSWQDVGGSVNRIASLRGRLYGVQANGNIWAVPDANVATWSWQLLYSSNATSIPGAWFEFNGALWLSIQGLTYRFDGVNLVEVLNHECQYAEVYNGAVYYMVKKWLYRFNGSVVEKLQYFDETVYGLRADDENLYIVTQSPLSKYSGYDSVKDPTDTLMGRLYYFNGTSFYEAYESYTSNPESGFASWPYGLARQKSGIVLIGCNVASGYGYARRHNQAEPQTGFIAIYSSEIDNGFPNNWKSLQYIDMNADGWASPTSEVVTVQVQTHNGLTWTAWQSVGTLQNGQTRITLPDTSTYLYKMIRIRCTVSTAVSATLSIRSFTLRYTLQPRQRANMKIGFVLPADTAQGTKDRRNVRISDSSISNANHTYAYRGLMSSLYSKLPVYIIGIDFATSYLTGYTALGTGTGTLAVLGNLIFSPLPNTIDEKSYIGFSNDDGVTWEIAEVSSVVYDATGTKTEITVSRRGALGSTITVGANTIVAPAIKTFCSRLIGERVIADGAYNLQTPSSEYSNTERVVSLEFAEV